MLFINFQPWSYIFFWFVIVLVAVIVELETIQLVSVWFAASGIVSMLLAAFNCSIEAQIIVFVILAAILFIFSRPLVKKLSKGKVEISTVESMIGETVVVTKEIKIGEIGEIKAKYDKYSAIAPSETSDIPIDTICVIKEIRGNKVIVEIK